MKLTSNYLNEVYREFLTYAISEDLIFEETPYNENEVCEICGINSIELQDWKNGGVIKKEKIVLLLLHMDLFKISFMEIFNLKKPSISISQKSVNEFVEYEKKVEAVEEFWNYAIKFDNEQVEQIEKNLINDFESNSIKAAAAGITKFIYVMPVLKNMDFEIKELHDNLPSDTNSKKKFIYSYDNIFENFIEYLHGMFVLENYGKSSEYCFNSNPEYKKSETLTPEEFNQVMIERAINHDDSSLSRLTIRQKLNLLFIEIDISQSVYDHNYESDPDIEKVRFRVALSWLAEDYGQAFIKFIFNMLVEGVKKGHKDIELKPFSLDCLETLFDFYVTKMNFSSEYNKQIEEFKKHIVGKPFFNFEIILASIKNFILNNELQFLFDETKRFKLIKNYNENHQISIEFINSICPLLPYLAHHPANLCTQDFHENYSMADWKKFYEEDCDEDVYSLDYEEADIFRSDKNGKQNIFFIAFEESLKIDNIFHTISSDLKEFRVFEIPINVEIATKILSVLGYNLKTLCNKPYKGFHSVSIIAK